MNREMGFNTVQLQKRHDKKRSNRSSQRGKAATPTSCFGVWADRRVGVESPHLQKVRKRSSQNPRRIAPGIWNDHCVVTRDFYAHTPTPRYADTNAFLSLHLHRVVAF